MNKQLIAALVLGLSASTGAHASLIARVGGMVYDDVNNITWATNANLFATQAAGNSNLVSEIIAANGGVIHDTPNDYDTVPNTGAYTLTVADFNTDTGQMTWWGAQAWVSNLTLGGLKGWSLPATADAANPNNYGYNITTSQMGDLFYNQLGGLAPTDLSANHNANYNLFSNVQDSLYWSSSEYTLDPRFAWYFVNHQGYQYDLNKYFQVYAWAVHVGDVTAVPLPGVVWLFGSAMLGLMGFNRRGNLG